MSRNIILSGITEIKELANKLELLFKGYVDKHISDKSIHAGITVSATQPTNPTSGDLWVDTGSRQLYAYVVDTWLLIGGV